jgi:microcystin-dependent protein
MANLTPTPVFDDVLQLETTDYVLGGSGGISNTQAQQLANRTQYLLGLYNALATALIPPVSGACLMGRVDSSTQLEILLTIPAGIGVQLNAAPSYPCILAFQNGFDLNGVEKVTYRRLTADIPISNIALGTAGQHLVYAQIVGTTVEINATARTIYIQGIAPAADNDALWYDYNSNVWYQGQGVSWVAVQVVPLGIVTVTAGVPSAIRTFPYGVPYYDRRTQAGNVIQSAANELPLGGYLLCDGTAVSRTRYARLFARIGTTWGSGNGSTTFNLPDMRGAFLRGFDNGRGVDAGRTFGTSQKGTIHAIDSTGTNQLYSAVMTSTSLSSADAALVAERTGLDYDANGATNYPNTTAAYANGDGSGGFNYGVSRPFNVTVNYYIKF